LESRRLLANSIWAFPGADGHMLYQPQPLGDHIQDYGMVGYMGGTVPIPNVPVKATISPVAGDNTANIQNAINTVAALPLDATGFRGAVVLNPGTYSINGVININASGVVLRGSGAANTIIYGSTSTDTTERTLINVNGSNSMSTSNTRNIIDKYVPVGAISFTVNDSSGFNVGDTVVIHRPSTQQWINDIGMNLLTNPWTPGSKDINMDRTITHIDGNVITIDAPITQALDLKYTDASQGTNTIYKYTAAGRLSNVGIENIGGISQYDPSVVDSSGNKVDENHPWTFINVDGAINSWVRNVSSQFFGYACVYVTNSKYVTTQDSECLDPVSQITGGRRYSFNIDGSQDCLFRNCYAREGRHDFVQGSTVTGPNVFVDDYSDHTHADAGPHHRYSTAALWDNIATGALDIQNRGNLGSGHGWAGANQVIWNSAASFTVQNPPTAQNWLIGSIGPIVNGTVYVGPHDPGIYDSSGPSGVNVTPRSLYYQQLGERMAYEDFTLREVRLGDADAFTSGDAVDSPPVDATWKTNIQNATGQTGVGFDTVANGQLIPFTFNLNLDPGTYVVGASLSLGVESTGGSTANDKIYLEDPSRAYTWSQLGVKPPGVGESGVVIDLSKYLAALEEGKLNLAVLGNTAIDWATLNFQTASTTQPASTTFTPTDDAYVQDGTSANTNFGAATTLQTKLDSVNNDRESFLKFDLSSLSGGSFITKATVRLVPTSVGLSSDTFASGKGAIFNQLAFVSDDTWTQSGITWNNKPASDTPFTEFISKQNAPLNIDVTALVRAAMTGDKKLSLRLLSDVMDTNGLISYGSAQNSDPTLRPQLIISSFGNALTPTADAFVKDGSSASTNFGTATDLETKKDSSANSGNNRDAFLKFDLTGVASAPAGATLRLIPINVGANLAETADFVGTDSWTETGITWNNKPATTTTLGTAPIWQATPAEWNVSSQVASTIAGDKLLSLHVGTNTVNSGVNYFASREFTDGSLVPLVVLKNLAPMITAVPTINGTTNTVSGPMWFGVWDAETAAGSLNVTASSSNTTLLPNANIALSGSGGDRFITLTPAANQTGSSNVTLTVADAQGAQTSYTFLFVIANALVVNGDQDMPNENDVIRIVRNGAFTDVYRNNTTTPAFHVDYASLASLTVNTGGGNDAITLDYTGGDPIPAGGFTLNGGSGADTFTIAGSSTAAVTLNMTLAGSGTMTMGSGSSALPSLTDLTIAAGETLNLNGQSQTIDSLNGDGTILDNVASNTVTLTVGQQNGDGSFTGSLANGTGTLNLVKTGSGTLTLDGANSYTGTTMISGGAIASGHSASFAGLSGQVLFNGGQFHVTANTTAANVANKFTTTFTGATNLSTGTFNIDTGVTLTIGGSNAALQTNKSGGPHAGDFTKTGLGTLKILSDDSQQDNVFHLSQGTIDLANFDGLGGSGARLDMSDGTTLILRQDTNTNFLTPINIASAGGEASVVIDRLTSGPGVTQSINALTSAGSFTLDVRCGANITGGTAGFTITNGTTLSGDGTFSVVNTPTVSTVLTTGAVSGAFSIDKIDDGTMTLAGANTYTGNTTVEEGTLQLGAAAGTLPATTNLTLGSAANNTAGVLDLNGRSASVNAIVATGDVSATPGEINSIVNLNAGQTLSVTGVSGTNAILVGGLTGLDNVITQLVVSGGGTLAVTSTGDILVDNDAVNSSSTHQATFDMSGLANFTADINNLNVGVSPSNSPRARGVMILAASNTITANAITLGKTNGNAIGGTELDLGQTNTIHANTITLASGKGDSATMKFRSGLTNPSVTIADKNTGVGADLLDGYKSASGTASPTGTVDLTAGTVNATLHSLVLGWQSQASANTATGVFSMSAGNVTAATLTVGQAAGSTATGNGTVNVNGGSFQVAGTSVLGSAVAGSTSNGTLNILGGAVTLQNDLTDGGGSSTLNLNGGSLNMSGHAIGSAAAPINTLTFAAGTLMNVSQINGGAGLTKTTAGTLSLDGTDAYTGATTVSAGTLIVASTGSVTGSTTFTAAVGATLDVEGSIPSNASVTANGTVKLAGNPSAATAFTRNLAGLTIATTGAVTLLWSNTSVLPAILSITTVSMTDGGGGSIDLGNNEIIAGGITLGVVRDNVVNGQIFTTRSGGAIGSMDLGNGTVEIRFTLLGDSNLDGTVNVVDLANLAGNFGATTGSVWVSGDFDYNGNTNVADLSDLAGNFGLSLGNGVAAAPAMMATATSSAATAAPAVTSASQPATGQATFSEQPLEDWLHRTSHRRAVVHDVYDV
jgi:autotransporter-associated beta strand protein